LNYSWPGLTIWFLKNGQVYYTYNEVITQNVVYENKLFHTQVKSGGLVKTFVKGNQFDKEFFTLVKRIVKNPKIILAGQKNVSDRIFFNKRRENYINMVPEASARVHWGEQVTELLTGRGKNRIKRTEMLLELISTKVSSILDIGGGNGEIGYAFANHFGIDARQLYITDVKDNRAAIYKSKTSFELLKDSEIHLPSESIDLILVFQVLHHVHELFKLLSEARQVLKNDGYLLLREHDCQTLKTAQLIDIEHMMYDLVVDGTMSYDQMIKSYYAIYRPHQSWENLLLACGFALVKRTKPFGPTQVYHALYKAM
jgi:ubiquinone/menaquinone biosynthesis C-methylase UbiE